MPDAQKMKQVVVAVDEGPHSKAAFCRALEMFNKETTHYNIVHVRPDPTELRTEEKYTMGLKGYLEEMEEQRRRKCQEVLGKFKALAEEAGVEYTIVELQGDARTELCLFCETYKADVLVLGSRGMGIIKRIFLGSVSDYCAHNAPCAVFIDHSDVEVTPEAPQPPLATTMEVPSVASMQAAGS